MREGRCQYGREGERTGKRARKPGTKAGRAKKCSGLPVARMKLSRDIALLLRSIMWLTWVRTMKQEKHYPKSLKSISKEKINSDYKYQNEHQQAGFSAEVKGYS